MAEAQQPGKLRASTVRTSMYSQHHDQIKVKRTSGAHNQRLGISFRRTIRVADNDKANNLPPDLGAFPVYETNSFKYTLPEDMKEKPGFFIPMYQREAMWIKFDSVLPFAIKVYVGGVNAVSGEPARETEVTMMRRLKLLQERKSIQDYVVAPKQLWLDGIASADGEVRQFVAMPLGKGYTVEAQITGDEIIGGMQFEITPCEMPSWIKSITRIRYPKPEGTEWFEVMVRHLDGDTTVLEMTTLHTFAQMKELISEIEAMPVWDLRLIYRGKQVDDDRTLAEAALDGPCTVHLVTRLRGGGGGAIPASMGLGAGGLIRQTIKKHRHKPTIWDPACSTIFNVQILNSDSFRAVTRQSPLPTSVTAEVYAEYGFPYFAIFDEKPSGIKGEFEGVKSVRELDSGGKPTPEKSKAVWEVMNSTNNEVVLLDHKGNRLGFRTVADIEKAVREQFGEMTI